MMHAGKKFTFEDERSLHWRNCRIRDIVIASLKFGIDRFSDTNRHATIYAFLSRKWNLIDDISNGIVSFIKIAPESKGVRLRYYVHAILLTIAQRVLHH